MTQKRVLIDVGHGYYDAPPEGHPTWDNGALGQDGLTEFQVNMLTATVVQQTLQLSGHYAAFVPFGLQLFQRGAFARDFDVFLSIHHNASETKRAQGAEVCVHRSLGNDADTALAFAIAKRVAGALGIKDRGVAPANLAVLRGARSTNVKVALLTEGFFLDSITATQARDWARPEGLAIAGAVNQALQSPL